MVATALNLTLPVLPSTAAADADAPPASPMPSLHTSGDKLAALAQRALGVRSALVALEGGNVVCAAGEALDVVETAVVQRLSRQMLAAQQPLIVPDLRRLPQFAAGAGRFVACAAVPLATPAGCVAGLLAVFDETPRSWTPADVDLLNNLAALAAAQFVLAGSGSADVAHERARYAALIDVGAAGVVEIDREGRCVTANAVAETLLGYGAALTGRDVHLFLHTRWDGTPQHEFERCPLTTVLRAGLRLGPEESVLQSSDGGRFYAECAIAPIVDENVVTGALLWFRDLTPRKQLEERLAQQAQTDGLTGIANRLVFAERLHDALTRASREDGSVAVLLLDLDNFSRVNQQYGNAAGDRLLVEVARRLSTCVRHGDLVARSGGDEFAVLLDHVSGVAEAQRVVERLQAGLRPPFPLAGGTLRIGASAGIAVMDGYCAADDLLRAAASALSTAKQAGIGHTVIAENGALLVD